MTKFYITIDGLYLRPYNPVNDLIPPPQDAGNLGYYTTKEFEKAHEFNQMQVAEAFEFFGRRMREVSPGQVDARWRASITIIPVTDEYKVAIRITES